MQPQAKTDRPDAALTCRVCALESSISRGNVVDNFDKIYIPSDHDLSVLLTPIVPPYTKQ